MLSKLAIKTKETKRPNIGTVTIVFESNYLEPLPMLTQIQ